jgi:hypothetical protein
VVAGLDWTRPAGWEKREDRVAAGVKRKKHQKITYGYDAWGGRRLGTLERRRISVLTSNPNYARN